MGLILENVHRVISFEQKPWLREYIMMNTELRTKSKNEFERALFKLMNNCIYGMLILLFLSRIRVVSLNIHSVHFYTSPGRTIQVIKCAPPILNAMKH